MSLRTLLLLFLSLPAAALHAGDVAPHTLEQSLAQDRKCLACHDELEAKPVLSIYQTRHGVKGDARPPTCQSCHGESSAHSRQDKIKGKRPAPDTSFSAPGAPLDSSAAQAQSAPCLQCHAKNIARHWQGSSHEGHGLACTSCHTLHTPRDPLLERTGEAEICYRCHQTQRAQMHRPSAHPVAAGKLSCRDCHDAHGSEGDRLLRETTVNDNCYTCHADLRGPFLWEHAPVTDNCLNCHVPHGSSNSALLKARSPWLCQQCHSSRGHPATAYSGAQLPGAAANPTSRIPLHGCANCHSRVHGSNHPSGARLLR